MTLVIALGNQDQVIQVSDRQLTDARGQPCVLPENKSTILNLLDSRFLVGFAGLARVGRFKTGRWILEALQDAAKDDHLASPTVKRFTELLTDRWSRPDLRKVPAEHRGLSVIFSGYIDSQPPPNLVWAIVTNFQNYESGQDEEPWDRFKANYWQVKEGVVPAEVSYVQRIGTWVAMVDSDVDRLRSMLEERRSAKALVDAGVGVVREIATRQEAGGFIGREVNSAVLPFLRPPELDQGSAALQMGFHPIGASDALYGSNQVISLPRMQVAVMDPKIEAVDSGRGTRPMAVQKVGRNKLCPCGSGKKFKKCCGR